MCAEILAIGPFTIKLVRHLEYPNDFYRDTLEGTPVVRIIFGIVEGSILSREFATLVGVTDPWDFNQHHLDPSKFDYKGLEIFSKNYNDYQKDYEAMLAFTSSGFNLYFLPNG
jgi:hypothetical protein